MMEEMESIGRMSVVVSGEETGFSYLFVVYEGKKRKRFFFLVVGIGNHTTLDDHYPYFVSFVFCLIKVA